MATTDSVIPAFVQYHQADSAEQVVRRLARAALEESGQEVPPFDPIKALPYSPSPILPWAS